VLSEFRARLAADDAAERMLDRLPEPGLLARGGRQRTDATHVLAAVRELNRLELVTETLRAVLEALAVVAPGWLHEFLPDEWYARYGQRARDRRLPKAEAAREALAVIVGSDGFALLEAVDAAEAPSWLGEVPAVQTLRRLWLQQYYRTTATSRACAGAARVSCRPARWRSAAYDSEARYGIKRGVGWRGDKAHFTETCEPDRPHLIVHVATTVAAANDVDTVAARHADLAGVDLLPDEHLVDAGYVSVDHVLAARADHGIELVGPLPPRCRLAGPPAGL
jgi:hypothetical protein